MDDVICVCPIVFFPDNNRLPYIERKLLRSGCTYRRIVFADEYNVDEFPRAYAMSMSSGGMEALLVFLMGMYMGRYRSSEALDA